MIMTNEMGLPESFVNFVSNARHNETGTISATTLLKGEKEIVLTDRHFDEITVDASDMVWATFGSAFHLLMEHQEDDSFKEERFEVPVGKFTVTGKVDRYDLEREILEDWKTASVWKVIYGDFADWKEQGLTYAWLLKQNGLTVKKCRFVALLKDHSKTEAKRKADYPQKPVYVYEFEVTDEDLKAVENRIVEKVAKVASAYELEDDKIAPCTAEERWATSDKYAVMKDGRKTALKVCDTKEEAEKLLSELGGTRIEERKGESKKCADYCPCREFCNFWKSLEK